MAQVRRLVTGHDERGKSIFLSVGEPPQWHTRRGQGVDFVEIWNTAGMPAPIVGVEPKDPNERLPLRIPPDPGGTIIRVLDLHPGHVGKLVPRADGRHAGMHRTETIDYGIMIEGELWLILDDAQERVRPGDVVVQRGTDHAWENRTDRVARIAFVLLDGKFDADLARRLGQVDLLRTTLPLRGG